MDERFSFLGRVAPTTAPELLSERLDTTHVDLYVGHGHEVLAMSLTNILARLVPTVAVAEGGGLHAPTPVFGDGPLGSAVSAVAKRVRSADPRPTRRTLRVGIGTETPDCELYISADEWNLQITNDRHEALSGADGPAAIAASALASARIALSLLQETTFRPPPSLRWNLVDYGLGFTKIRPGTQTVKATVFGMGSVGSSVIYALLLSGVRGSLAVIDDDVLRTHNRLRYPLWVNDSSGTKVAWIRDLCRETPLAITPHEMTAAEYVFRAIEPIELAISAVDSSEGRREIADALARVTLNAGVDGLKLHVSRHLFGDGLACVYCPYVDVEREMDEAAFFAGVVGLDEDRVRAILGGENANPADLKRLNLRRQPGRPFAGDDLRRLVRRRAYADAVVHSEGIAIAVSAPFVSALTGAIVAAEIIKDGSGLELDRRVDVDMSGYPTGYQRRVVQDETKRCLCWDAFRLDEYRTAWPTG